MLYGRICWSANHKTIIQNLKELSRLDDSQAHSLVYSLCREIALIEGPPGTGKTFVGVELMRISSLRIY
ncbi:P-loop containing nucleoside triphosphate hydrolase protein [Gigaspora margarita]|uniref:P-loop containing nucleoside triphosphate hydrolase protein n=1 Tax=Gigaspora margarita TaxID=4874 RepID=A0A8H3XLR0_GIGMA|nr:P-loop containing nucleoside triphosphate hydrolase protein [Gigaspora margarita]